MPTVPSASTSPSRALAANAAVPKNGSPAASQKATVIAPCTDEFTSVVNVAMRTRLPGYSPARPWTKSGEAWNQPPDMLPAVAVNDGSGSASLPSPNVRPLR